MATINNIAELLAWGETPNWVENQFNKKFSSGTATGKGTGKKSVSNGWGGKKNVSYTYTYTYTVYGLSDISTGSGSFNSSNWNSWDASTKGSNANKTYTDGGYGIALNDGSLTITQPVGDLTFGTAVKDVQTDTATGSDGAQLISYIDNTGGSAAIEQTISFAAEETVSSGSSVSNGYSNTTAVEVGAEVSAEFMGIGASVNSSVTDETTIDTSSTTDTSVEKTVSNSISNTYTVEPGYKIKVQMQYENQKINLPYTFPVSVTGTAKYTDKWGNSWSAGAGDNIQNSIDYGAPSAEYMSASSSTAGSLEASGYITNINASSFTTSQTTLVTPESSSSKSDKVTPRTDLPTVLKDGEEVEVGIHYDVADTKDAEGAHLHGSKNSDYIVMGAKDQKATTFGGDDTVVGSKHSDVIVSKGDDKVESGKGADKITSTTGSTDIHAGGGKDEVNITSKGGGFDDVTLGGGKDKVSVDLKAGDKYSFVIRDLSRKEYLDVNSKSDVTAETKGNTIEVSLDGKYVGSIGGYVDDFANMNGYKAAEISLMNMDKLAPVIDTAHVENWKDDLMAVSALTGWSAFAKRYGRFAKPNKKFNENSKALSTYMYGKVEDEFVDAMTKVIGNKGIKDMTDHVDAAIDTLSKDLQDYFKPDLFF